MSQILGSGFGDSHDWRVQFASGGRITGYKCARCPAMFQHDNTVTKNVFDAIRKARIPDQCPGLPEAEAIDDPVKVPDDFRFAKPPEHPFQPQPDNDSVIGPTVAPADPTPHRPTQPDQHIGPTSDHAMPAAGVHSHSTDSGGGIGGPGSDSGGNSGGDSGGSSGGGE